MRLIISTNTQKISDANIVKGLMIVVKDQSSFRDVVEPRLDFEQLDGRVLSLASE
jgi:hypothetical protein